MRARLLTASVLAAGLGLAAAVPSNAAAAPQIVDPAGDANALNGQGLVEGAPGQATAPASLGSLDITSVQWATKFNGSGKRKTATHILVTMSLAAPATETGQSAVWRATANFGDCSFSLAYEVTPGLPATSYLRICDSGTLGYVDVPATATVSGAKIGWSVPIKSLKSYGIKLNSVADTLGAHSRLVLVAATVPQVDEALSSKVYKVGS